MKKIIIMTILFLTPATAYLQWEMSSIYKDASDYFQAILDQDIEKMMTYLHPEFTESETATEIIEAYLSSLSSPEGNLEYTEISFVSASDITKHGNLSYRAVFYQFNLQVDLTADEEAEPDFWLEVMEQQFGKKNVKYDQKTKLININGKNGMYAFKKGEADHWKFIDDQAHYFLEDIIPEDVLNSFAVSMAAWRVSNL